jgi:hypothetical protein
LSGPGAGEAGRTNPLDPQRVRRGYCRYVSSDLARKNRAGSAAAHAAAGLAGIDGLRAVVLVEGMSDRAALEMLAGRRGLPLAIRGIAIAAMGGATNVGHYFAALGPRGADIRLAGLCDAAEEPYFRRALSLAGLGAGESRRQLEAAGFYVCTADLEDELIRAVGTGAVEEIITGQGDLGSFRTFQRQPAQQDRSIGQQLHRFMGTRSGRKAQYARALASAVDLGRVPPPLDGLLDHLCAASANLAAED